MEASYKRSLRCKLNAYQRSPLSLLLFLLVMAAALLTLGSLLFLTGYIMIKGIPHLKPGLFAWKYNTVNMSLMPALINTVLMTLIALLLAAPVGIFAAIYLVEYAQKRNGFVGMVRITAETLAGIPSIVYGLFGLLFFVTALGWGMSLLAGAFTLAMMILPLIMRTAEEALKAVPAAYREGSYGLGAGKLRTVFQIVLPSAARGILAGVILGIGRVVGETAALIYTAGTVAEIPGGRDFLFDSTRTLAVHLFALASEGLHVNQAAATAVVLFMMVALINWLSELAGKKLGKV